MLFQDWPRDVLHLSLAFVQEQLGGGDQRSVVTADFDLGRTIHFHRASTGGLRLAPGQLDGGDLQRQDIGTDPFTDT